MINKLKTIYCILQTRPRELVNMVIGRPYIDPHVYRTFMWVKNISAERVDELSRCIKCGHSTWAWYASDSPLLMTHPDMTKEKYKQLMEGGDIAAVINE